MASSMEDTWGAVNPQRVISESILLGLCSSARHKHW